MRPNQVGVLSSASPNCNPAGVHPIIAQAQVDAVSSQLADLEAELREYQAIREGRFEVEALRVFTKLPELLIKARIAQGLTQRELADRLGLKEQQIQRYEATDYAAAKWSRIRGGGRRAQHGSQWPGPGCVSSSLRPTQLGSKMARSTRQSPEARVADVLTGWQESLLQLDRRNRLLNFRPGTTAVKIVDWPPD